MNLNKLSIKNLFHLYGDIMEELRGRKILRSNNNPVSDYAEYLVSKKFNLKLAPLSTKSFDAIDKLKNKYQIKARRYTKFSAFPQLGVIRSTDFKFLIAVIFYENFDILAMYKIPKKIVLKYARFSKHQNGYILRLTDKVLMDKSIRKIK